MGVPFQVFTKSLISMCLILRNWFRIRSLLVLGGVHPSGVHTRRSPADIMAEVFRALQALGIGWKRHAPYNIKCRHVIAVPHLGPAPCPEMGRAEVVLKFEVQVRLMNLQFAWPPAFSGSFWTLVDLCTVATWFPITSMPWNRSAMILCASPGLDLVILFVVTKERSGFWNAFLTQQRAGEGLVTCRGLTYTFRG